MMVDIERLGRAVFQFRNNCALIPVWALIEAFKQMPSDAHLVSSDWSDFGGQSSMVFASEHFPQPAEGKPYPRFMIEMNTNTRTAKIVWE